jgi:hypothetical protein
MKTAEAEAQRLRFIEELKQKSVLTPEEEATFEICLDPETYYSCLAACESTRCNPLLRLKDVFKK